MLMLIGIILFFIISILPLAIKILQEYERAVIFTLGRFTRVGGPGLIIIVPFVQQISRVDLRIVVMDIPPQDVISQDNISGKVNAVLYFRVIDPEKAIIQVENFLAATSQLSQTTLRSVLGQHDLDDMLAEREKLNTDIQKIVDEQTDNWGIKVSNVEIKDIDLTEGMVRVIAKQAEAERERRAKVIYAEGELQASKKLKEAAAILSQESQAMQLRYLQTLTNMAAENNHSTVLFPFPMDIIEPFLAQVKKK